MTRFLPLLVVFLLGITSSAHATLVLHDSPFGPGTLIEDTTHGLEALKVTASTHIGIDALEASLLPGGRFDGYRYGTIAEYGLLRSELPAGIEGSRAFIELLGPTILGTGGVEHLFILFGPGNRVIDQIPAYSISLFFDAQGGPYIESDTQAITFGSANERVSFRGYFLVAEPAAVPGPAGLVLLGVGVVVAYSAAAWSRSGSRRRCPLRARRSP